MLIPEKAKALELAQAAGLHFDATFSKENVIELAEAYETYLSGEKVRIDDKRIETVKAARAAHEAIRTLQIYNNEPNVASPWEQTPKDIRESCYIGIDRVRENPDISNEDLHNSWIETKKSQGWKYGEVRSEDEKTHPCLVPYEELPEFQRLKDAMFRNVVKAVLGF